MELQYNHHVSLARPLSLYYNLTRPLGLHYNHYVSQSVRPSGCGQLVKMIITGRARYCQLIITEF